MSSEPIVDINDLRKTYRSRVWTRTKSVEALRGVSLTAFSGEVFGLLGPNGAGKTTLIKSLLGVIQPTSGRSSLFGLPIGNATARARVGYLPESLRIDRHHTARTALRYYGRLSRMHSSDIQRRTDELLELVGLKGRDREPLRRFSKGMSQRLGLAQALLHDPDLLVLDEPTDGLDPVGRNEVRLVIERLRDSGKTVFLNSHILQEVELVCSRVAVMAGGRIKAVGTIDEIAGQTESRYEIIVRMPASSGATQSVDQVQRLVSGCFPPEAVSDLMRLPESGMYRVQVALADQSHVDRAVDALRNANISIQKMLPLRATLEETFMRLVQEKSDAGTPIRAVASGATVQTNPTVNHGQADQQ